MYIMYGIQGYIARTVNHDQKVPKHWREIEDERGKKKCNAKESLDILLRIVHARSITSDSTITRTRCMSIHTHARVTYTCINGTHVRVHTMNMHIYKKKREKKEKDEKNTTVFVSLQQQLHLFFDSHTRTHTILNQTFFFSGQREGSRIYQHSNRDLMFVRAITIVNFSSTLYLNV